MVVRVSHDGEEGGWGHDTIVRIGREFFVGGKVFGVRWQRGVRMG